MSLTHFEVRKLMQNFKDKLLIMKFQYIFYFFFGFNFVLSAQSYDELFEDKYGIEVLINKNEVSDLSFLENKNITLDHGCSHNTIALYVNKDGLNHLVENKIPFKVKTIAPAVIQMKNYSEISALKKGGNCLPAFDYYPTYEAYEELMYSFEAQYPEICKIINIGTLTSGRKLLVAQIGDNLDIQENEPNFLYSASMHGDELAGYPTMIKLIDHLLCNYGSDDKLTDLVDNINIFINPLANPNGAYTNDNSTVNGARRENASFVDLNRNYPDPIRGDNPDGRSYQEETQAFVKFSQDYNINLSCNLHGGAELVNYPWDTIEKTHADNDWWVNVSRNYADTVQHNSPNGYFEQQNNGIVLGFNWFKIHGGRQDHMTYFRRGREFTLELSNVKLLNSDELPNIWNYHRNALINYLNESLYGLRGTITDCETGLPISAEIIIEGHDEDNSSVFSNEEDGRYFRYLNKGQYVVSFIAEGYDKKSETYDIIDKSSILGNIELCSEDISMTIEDMESSFDIVQQGNKIKVIAENTEQDYHIYIYTNTGQLVMSSQLIDMSIDINDNFPLGIYHIKVISKNVSTSKTLLIK